MDLFAAPIDIYILLAQGMGFLAFFIFILSFQQLKPRYTCVQQAVADIFFVLHFWGLGQGFLAVLCSIACVRDFGSGFLKKGHHKILMLAYVLALYSAAFIWADHVLDWIAVLASTLITVAQLYRDRFYMFRFLNIVPEFLWLVVYALIGSWSGVVFASLFIVSNIVGVVRYMRMKLKA